jgi:hypothetical protein
MWPWDIEEDWERGTENLIAKHNYNKSVVENINSYTNNLV